MYTFNHSSCRHYMGMSDQRHVPTASPKENKNSVVGINPLKKKRNMLHIKTLCVPRSKHFQPRL
jgi:hypothetical protein